MVCEPTRACASLVGATEVYWLPTDMGSAGYIANKVYYVGKHKQVFKLRAIRTRQEVGRTRLGLGMRMGIPKGAFIIPPPAAMVMFYA